MKTHAELAVSNHEQATAPDGPVPLALEWRITMHFYAAVHAVNHVRFGGEQAPKGYRHDDRRRDLEFHPTLRHIARQYDRLENLATVARYLPDQHPMTKDQVSSALTWSVLVMTRAGVKVPSAGK